MKKGLFPFYLLYSVVCITLVACGKKVTIYPSPENDIIIDYMEEIIQNQEKYEDFIMIMLL